MPPSIYIATPVLGGQNLWAYTTSLVETALYLQRHGVRFGIVGTPNGSALAYGRNGLAAAFLQTTDFSNLFFIDADMGWRAADVLRLASCCPQHDVVCGVYRMKKEPIEWAVRFLPDAHEHLHCCATCGAIEILRGPTGFMSIRREILERMIALHPELACRFDKDWQGHALFNNAIDEAGGWFVGEDYGFCKLLRECGGSVWALPDIRLEHYGGKVFAGSLEEFLVTEQPIPLEVCK